MLYNSESASIFQGICALTKDGKKHEMSDCRKAVSKVKETKNQENILSSNKRNYWCQESKADREKRVKEEETIKKWVALKNISKGA